MAPPGPKIVLVDTSAWISFFARTGYPAIKRALGALLQDDRVATAGPIALELIQGCRSAAERDRLERNLRTLHWLAVDDAHWYRAGALAFRLRRRGVTVSAIDSLIATLANSYGCSLLQQDGDFDHIARLGGLRLMALE